MDRSRLTGDNRYGAALRQSRTVGPRAPSIIHPIRPSIGFGVLAAQRTGFAPGGSLAGYCKMAVTGGSPNRAAANVTNIIKSEINDPQSEAALG